ncbi:hypothetical protein [Thermococcus gammatolerans]|nr:hypothetical protein [Thermococcus gammatolerans]
MVYFTVKVRNYRPDKLDVRGFIEDEAGAVIVKMGDSGVYTIPAREEKSFSFSYTLYGIANHTFKLFIDNTDGKPNGNGDEKWKKVKVEVKPIKGIGLKQVGVECDNLYFKYDMGNYKAKLACKFVIYNGYNFSLEVNGKIMAKMNASVLNKYLQSDSLVTSINPHTISAGQYFAINSTAYFEISKSSLPRLIRVLSGAGLIFPYWEDAANDIRVETEFYGATIPIEITYDVPFDRIGIQRFTFIESTYIEVDQIAVVTDVATDVFLTYELKTKTIPLADIEFIQNALNKLPPSIRQKVSPITNPLLQQISINWLANWMKEKLITEWRG